MKIGIWIGNEVPIQQGGAFSYTSKLIKEIDNYPFSKNIDIVFLTLDKNIQMNKETIYVGCLPDLLYKLLTFSKLLTKLLSQIDFKILKILFYKSFFHKKGIKVIYYIKQSQVIFPDFPFVATNWDIGHMSTYSFPELINNGEFKRRDYYYNHILPKALSIFCESESGKDELLKYTNIGEHKIRIIPLFSGDVVHSEISQEISTSILHEMGLYKNKFFFYPAQFWAHKNHYNLIKSFYIFHKSHPEYKLILCGSDKGNKEYIHKLIEQYELKYSIFDFNFISSEKLYCLYTNATALIMASHFGPTNMPPIEALELECPVMCSDLKGHREILGNAASYFNSFDYNSILKSFNDIIDNREYYKNQIINQKKDNVFNSQYALQLINNCLEEVVTIRSNWD